MTRYRRTLAALATAALLAGGAAAVPAPAIASVVRPAALASPVMPMRALALFEAPAQPWSAGHRGIDLAAVPGQQVAAPAGGVIRFSGRVVDRGVVTVDHGGGAVSSLEPVTRAVAVGTAVRAGDSLGVVETVTGHCAPLTCIHWGVRVDGDYVDPLDLLIGLGPVVLLPVTRAGEPARDDEALS